jgi:hypothetical protein
MFKIQLFLKRGIKNYIRILSIVIILFPAFGNAKDVRIGPDIVSTTIPRGYCYLDSTKQPDTKLQRI